MVATVRLIWLTPPPISPGTIRSITRLTSGLRLGQGNRRCIPVRWQVTASHRNCSMPAMVTAMLRVSPDFSVGWPAASKVCGTTL